jgi:2-dehydro-3-deoxygluconokinase
VRDAIAATGVDVSGVRTHPNRPTGLLVKDPGADGTRVHYYRRGSAASALGPELLDEEAGRSAALAHLAERIEELLGIPDQEWLALTSVTGGF